MKKGSKKVWLHKDTKKEMNFKKLKNYGFIVASRVDDRLPLTKIKLSETTPCLDPTLEPIQDKEHVFEPEFRFKYPKVCEKEKGMTEALDKRYKKIKFVVKESHLFKFNSVAK